MTCRGLMTLLLVTLIELISTASLVAARDQPKPNCPKACGNISITFPFGTNEDCYLNDNFFINCTDTDQGPQPLLRTGNIKVLNPSLDGTITISFPVAKRCYNSTGGEIIDPRNKPPGFIFSAFTISSTRNKFTVVGCDTYAYVRGLIKKDDYNVGCMSLCNRFESVEGGSCSGIGCCQASVPDGVKDLTISLRSLSNYTGVHNFSSCGYAFVTEVESFNFLPADLKDLRNRNDFPMVIDYAIGNSTCIEAKKNTSSYACRSEYSECQNSKTGKGYICNCTEGFQGNPYLIDGCQDIKECQDPTRCKGHCEELPGKYRCFCPEGYDGDGETEPCYPRNQSKRTTMLYVALGIVSSILILVMGSSWLYHVSRERKLLKLREKFFLKNGGSLLLQKLSEQKGCTTRAIIFTEEDLKKSTDNFSEATIIGKGGFGTVYKGVLSDNRIVAIKKSKVTDPSQNEQFINEVIILSQVNHRHVVKILGCCLETEVPLIVYEFIPNGTVYRHIHDEQLSSIFTWDIRLKVAMEAAGALAYLHSAASVPIIHRDVKSVNILLDSTYNAKVADFGASRFIPADKTEVTTLVQGTFGYLDPEYFHSSQLTDKSDVYSFGVVLAELITGQEAVSFNKSENGRNLAMYFVSSLNEDKLPEILDHRLVVQERKIEQIQEVAFLAKRCLNVKAEERPSMKEVAMELEGLNVMRQHPWSTKNDLNSEETEYLLNTTVPSSSHYGLVGSSIQGFNPTAAYDSMNDQIIVHLNDGR